MQPVAQFKIKPAPQYTMGIGSVSLGPDSQTQYISPMLGVSLRPPTNRFRISPGLCVNLASNTDQV